MKLYLALSQIQVVNNVLNKSIQLKYITALVFYLMSSYYEEKTNSYGGFRERHGSEIIGFGSMRYRNGALSSEIRLSADFAARYSSCNQHPF